MSDDKLAQFDRACQLLTLDQATQIVSYLPCDGTRKSGSTAFRASLRRYGISDPVDLKILYFASHGGCGICGRGNPEGVLCIDHNHKTGLYRGLLCHRCNRAIGAMEDDPMLLGRAFQYLTGKLK